MKRADKRDYLIEVAMQMFNRGGFRGTGIDEIMAETGIAKTTLYRHFASKDELIIAALAKSDEATRDELRTFVERASDNPLERILATFDQLDIWIKDGEFKGCPFVAAASEFCDVNHPIFQQVRMHKRLYLAYFEELVRAAGISEPKRFAAQILMLHEGAVSFAQVLGSDGTSFAKARGAEGVASIARIAAAHLIEAAAKSKSGESEVIN
jgi:AcrR family transcriptional regulator